MKPFEPNQIKTFRTPKYTGITLSLLSMFVLTAMFAVWNQITPQISYESTLNILCENSLRNPLENSAKEFEEELKIKIQISYFKNSNSSLNKNAKNANLMICYDREEKDRRSPKKEKAETFTIANDSIVFALPRKFKLVTKSFSEILDLNITVGLCYPDSRPWNKIQKIISHNHFENSQFKFFESEIELVSSLQKSNQFMGGFLRRSMAIQNDFQILQLEELKNEKLPILCSILSPESHSVESFKFIRYLTSHSRGSKHFSNFNFFGINGDDWAEIPSISIFCEPSFEEAIKSSILSFNEKEKIKSEILSTEKEKILFSLISISQSSAQAIMPDLLIISTSTEKKISPNYERFNSNGNFKKMHILLYRNSKNRLLCKRLIKFIQSTL